MDKDKKQGREDFFRGKYLNNNPHQSETEAGRDWTTGYWEAHDDWKQSRKERGYDD